VAPEFEPQDRLRRRLEKLVSETGREYCQWLRAREMVPVIQAVADGAETLRRSELEWLLHRLPDLAEDERAIVEQMSHRLVAALLHAPLTALHDDDAGSLERAARDLFGV
jgi:glutamyl-tRNA reductase